MTAFTTCLGTSGFIPAPIQSHSTIVSKGEIRTVPELVEYNTERNADHLFCVQTHKHGKTTERLLNVTHQQLKRAVLQCQAWLLHNVSGMQLPRRGGDGNIKKGAAVALLMESDIGLWIYLLSLMGLGVPAVLLSARLSPAAVHHLLKQTGAGAIITGPRLQSTASEGISLFSDDEKKPAQHVRSHYESFICPIKGYDTTGKSICHPNHYVDELDRAVLILHSSGTTGLPKPIHHPHRFLLNYTVCHLFSGAEEAEGLNLSTLPLYHGAGLVAPSLSLGVGKTVCLPPTSIISTGASILELLKLTKARSLMTVPSTLEEISLLPDEAILQLLPLQFVAFGGGRLKPSVGEKLAAAGVRLLNHYGTTETGSLSPVFVPGPDYDWAYFRLRKDVNLTVDPIGHANDGTQHFKLVARPCGWDTTFEVPDQLVSNPRNPMTDFSTVGRNDDLICLATGEKVFPGILESMLSETKNVKAAIAFGEGQFELGVLVEPSIPVQPENMDEFKTSIWPVITDAGDLMDGHARIASKDAVIVVPPGKALPRSDKGSVMRKESYRVFESKIAEAYRILENLVWDSSSPPLDMDNLEQGVKKMIGTKLNWRIHDDQWSVTDDLFELGMDSLQALHLRRLLLRSIPTADNSTPLAERITREFVYMHPSVAKLASALRQEQPPSGAVPGREKLIDQLVSQYSLPGPDASNRINPRPGAVVLLTGSTGSLGSYVLAHLANLEYVARVVCLNRVRTDRSVRSPQDPYDRQLRAMESRGIFMSKKSWRKVTVFETNMAAPLLGLSDLDYAALRDSVTHIIHNAWPMDFKRRLPSFKAQFQTIRNALTLCREAHKLRPAVRPTIVFVSSIAVVGQYPVIQGDCKVPEKPMVDSRSTNPFGYGEAKLVCEKILENAARSYHDEMSVKYIRCSQIAGSKETGFWNTEEHFPALVKSSQKIGVLPRIEGTLSWLPVDICAQALSDITLSPEETGIAYHLENPVRQPWHDALSIIAKELRISDSNHMSFQDWLQMVDSHLEGSSDENPAKKLIDFFQHDFQRMVSGTVILDTSRARKVSAVLRSTDALSRDTISGYVRYWKSVGFLK